VNWSALLPPTTTESSMALALPALVRVTVWVVADLPTAVDAKLNAASLSDQDRAALLVATPVPLRLRLSGELLASLTMLSVPAAAPVATGVKLRFSVQLALAARDVPQVCVSAYTALLTDRLVRARAASPVLLSVTLWVLEEPRFTLPNARPLDDSDTAGPLDVGM
jgi:hypothetical protein